MNIVDRAVSCTWNNFRSAELMYNTVERTFTLVSYDWFTHQYSINGSYEPTDYYHQQLPR